MGQGDPGGQHQAGITLASTFHSPLGEAGNHPDCNVETVYGSPLDDRFRANRTLSRYGRRTEFHPTRTSAPGGPNCSRLSCNGMYPYSNSSDEFDDDGRAYHCWRVNLCQCHTGLRSGVADDGAKSSGRSKPMAPPAAALRARRSRHARHLPAARRAGRWQIGPLPFRTAPPPRWCLLGDLQHHSHCEPAVCGR
jgi:hypothetical protein